MRRFTTDRGARARVARWAPALAALAAFVAAVVACAQTNVAVEGGDCFAATDCDVGLICAVGKDGRRACTKDLTGTTKVPGSSSGGTTDARSDAPSVTDASVATDAPSVVVDTGVDAPVVIVDSGPDVVSDASGD
ncbi:MAG: hypothetical protein U0174_24135 [Polyangiaceae bacterium]